MKFFHKLYLPNITRDTIYILSDEVKSSKKLLTTFKKRHCSKRGFLPLESLQLPWKIETHEMYTILKNIITNLKI